MPFNWKSYLGGCSFEYYLDMEVRSYGLDMQYGGFLVFSTRHIIHTTHNISSVWYNWYISQLFEWWETSSPLDFHHSTSLYVGGPCELVIYSVTYDNACLLWQEEGVGDGGSKWCNIRLSAYCYFTCSSILACLMCICQGGGWGVGGGVQVY